MEKADLQKQIAEIVEKQNSGDSNNETRTIPRPNGTAGTHFSIQEAMGLAGSQKKYETYKAIQVRGQKHNTFKQVHQGLTSETFGT